MLRRVLITFACSLGLLGSVSAADGVVVTTFKGPFADVRDAVVAAIEGKGLVINYVARISGMLDRTGADIGATQRIYEHAETFEFCSAGISRKMMERDPTNIVNCPFSLAVYALPGTPDKVFVAYRRPMGGLSEVENLLKAIIADAR